MGKNILIVVDMQNDFLTGALANTAGVNAIPNVVDEILKDKYDVVIATKDTHFDETNKDLVNEDAYYFNTLEGKNLPVKHCIKFSEGWELDSSVLGACKRAKEFHTIEKYTFGWDGWKKYFEKWDVEEVTLCGVVSSICVAANAIVLRHLFPNLKINVVKDACAGLSNEDHEAAMTVLTCQQINVI